MTDRRALDRFGIGEGAERVWRCLLENPSASIPDLANVTDSQPPEVVESLVALAGSHLVRVEPDAPSGYIPNDPGVALEVLAVREERQIAAETERVASFRSQIPELVDLFEAGRSGAGILPGFEVLTSTEEIRRQLYLEGERATNHLSLYHRTRAEALLHSRETDRLSLKRGAKMRSVVRTSDLRLPGLYEATSWLHEQGEEIRALEAVPTQMKILDRRLAVVRVDPEDSSKGAMFIRVQNLVDLLIDLFERMWDDAEPLFPDASRTPALTSRQLRILTLIAAGAKDEAIARSVAVGLRTIRRDISELKDLASASSRTDLITSAMRHGWIPTPAGTASSDGGSQSGLNNAAEIR